MLLVSANKIAGSQSRAADTQPVRGKIRRGTEEGKRVGVRGVRGHRDLFVAKGKSGLRQKHAVTTISSSTSIQKLPELLKKLAQ